jgi:YesN/AraC family two-component response regulator
MLHAKHSISDKLAKQLYSQYGNYRMMTIAAQSHAGGADRLFELLNDYFIDTLECKSIVMGELVQTYIVSAVYEPAEIVAIVSGYFDETSLDAVVYIGVSNWSDNFQQLHVLYAEAMERMLSNQMGGHKSYGIVVADRDGDKKPPATITMEIINTIATHAVKGSPQDVQTVLEQLFVLDQSMRLRDVISYYEQLSSLLLMLINQSGNGADAETFKCVQQRLYYNPYYMYNLLLEDFKRLNACVSQPTQSLKYEVIDYINQHYMEVLSLDSISEIFGITPVYLSSWFKKNTGVNLSAYIANVRMEEAKRLLATNQNLKIAEVSASVGIPVASTFIRQFKNYFGCTPDQYRQLVLTERHASKPSNAEAGQADD